MSLRVVLAALLASSLGCSSPEFRPVEAERSTPVELAAAWYDLVLDGRDLGDVKVWSHGAPASPLPEVDPGRQLLLGLRVKNDAGAAMRLDLTATQLEVHPGEGQAVDLGRPQHVHGDLTVPPGAVQRIDLVYVLPFGLHLRDVLGYELSWALEVGDRRVTRSTAFRRAQHLPEVRYYPYDPYRGGPWRVDPWWAGWGVPFDEPYPGAQ